MKVWVSVGITHREREPVKFGGLARATSEKKLSNATLRQEAEAGQHPVAVMAASEYLLNNCSCQKGCRHPSTHPLGNFQVPPSRLLLLHTHLVHTYTHVQG